MMKEDNCFITNLILTYITNFITQRYILEVWEVPLTEYLDSLRCQIIFVETKLLKFREVVKEDYPLVINVIEV